MSLKKIFSALLLFSSAIAQSPIVILPVTAIKYQPRTDFPAGVQITFLHGDPQKAGAFIYRIKFPNHFVLLPHSNSIPVNFTLLSGTLYLGTGDVMQKNRAVAIPTGSFFSIPANLNHYCWSQGESVIQIAGVGPLTMHFVDTKAWQDLIQNKKK